MEHTCPYCNGFGVVTKKPKYVSRMCPHCGGSGGHCKFCNGKGWQALLVECY